MADLNFGAKRFIVVNCGAGQTGKSTSAFRLLINGNYACRFVFDPENEAAQRLGLEPTRTLYDLTAHLSRGWVLFDPELLFGSDFAGAFESFCEWVLEKATAMPGQKILMVDEVWRYMSPTKIPPSLADCIRLGRKRGLHMVFNTQTVNKLHGDLRAEASEIIAFRQTDALPLNVLAERGFNPDEVKALPDLHFISRTDQGAELRDSISL